MTYDDKYTMRTKIVGTIIHYNEWVISTSSCDENGETEYLIDYTYNTSYKKNG